MFISTLAPLLALFVSAAGAPEAAPFLRGRGDDGELHPRHAGPGAAEFRKFGTAFAAAVSKATKEAEPPELKAMNMGVENLLNHRATQSSVASGGVAWRAIDGNTDGDYDNGSVTHTSEEDNPWWELDLRTTSPISAIKVYNRVDSCCKNRLAGAAVEILNAEKNPVWTGTIADVKDRYEFQFGSVRGRYIKISKGERGWLSLAEVEVYGPAGGCPAAGPTPGPTGLFSYMGDGICQDFQPSTQRPGNDYPFVAVSPGDCESYSAPSAGKCAGYCRGLPTEGAPTLRGFELKDQYCYCLYDATPDATPNFLGGACKTNEIWLGKATGPIASVLGGGRAAGYECYAFNN